MTDRYEKLWREYWAATHKPDANGEYYFDRHDREDREAAARKLADERAPNPRREP